MATISSAKTPHGRLSKQTSTCDCMWFKTQPFVGSKVTRVHLREQAVCCTCSLRLRNFGWPLQAASRQFEELHADRCVLAAVQARTIAPQRNQIHDNAAYSATGRHSGHSRT